MKFSLRSSETFSIIPSNSVRFRPNFYVFLLKAHKYKKSPRHGYSETSRTCFLFQFCSKRKSKSIMLHVDCRQMVSNDVPMASILHFDRWTLRQFGACCSSSAFKVRDFHFKGQLCDLKWDLLSATFSLLKRLAGWGVEKRKWMF